MSEQCAKILARLERGPATGLDFVLDCGVLNYGARIRELRKRGHRIESTEKRVRGTRIVTYELLSAEQLYEPHWMSGPSLDSYDREDA